MIIFDIFYKFLESPNTKLATFCEYSRNNSRTKSVQFIFLFRSEKDPLISALNEEKDSGYPFLTYLERYIPNLSLSSFLPWKRVLSCSCLDAMSSSLNCKRNSQQQLKLAWLSLLQITFNSSSTCGRKSFEKFIKAKYSKEKLILKLRVKAKRLLYFPNSTDFLY